MTIMKKSLNLGSKIKQARKAAGLSQKQLAEELRVSDKAVSSYEVNRAQPGIDTLREISKLTYKPITYFLEQSPNGEASLEEKILTIEQELQAAAKGLLSATHNLEEIKKLLQKKT